MNPLRPRTQASEPGHAPLAEAWEGCPRGQDLEVRDGLRAEARGEETALLHRWWTPVPDGLAAYSGIAGPGPEPG